NGSTGSGVLGPNRAVKNHQGGGSDVSHDITMFLGNSWSGSDFVGAIALSQQAPPVRVRGTIERVEGPIYVIKARDGAEVKLTVAEKPSIATWSRRRLRTSSRVSS